MATENTVRLPVAMTETQRHRARIHAATAEMTISEYIMKIVVAEMDRAEAADQETANFIARHTGGGDPLDKVKGRDPHETIRTRLT